MNNDLHNELESPEEVADRHFTDWESQKAENIKDGQGELTFVSSVEKEVC